MYKKLLMKKWIIKIDLFLKLLELLLNLIILKEIIILVVQNVIKKWKQMFAPFVLEMIKKLF